MPQNPKEDSLFQVLLDRVLGSKAPEKPAPPPNIAEALRIAKQERPDLADVELYGPLSRLLQGKAQGYVSPGRTIYLNPETLQGFGAEDIADTLIHEQTHVDQMKRRDSSSVGELLRLMFGRSEGHYGERPDEMEAFQAEKLRRYRMGRPQTPVPSFSNPGQFRIPADIHLPAETPKRKK